MLSKAFIAGVWEKTFAAEPALSRDDFFMRMVANPDGMFGPHYKIVFDKWDKLRKQELTAPKKMKTFAETNQGKKLAKKSSNKGGLQATAAD